MGLKINIDEIKSIIKNNNDSLEGIETLRRWIILDQV
jgi:hypothetical protein